MGLKSKNYSGKIKYNIGEDNTKITELFYRIEYYTKRLKNISNVIYLFLIITLCQTLLFNPFWVVKMRNGYFGEFSLFLPLLIASLFGLAGIFSLYFFDKTKRRGMIRYEIFLNFIEKKVKLDEGGEKINTLKIRIALKDFLDSCNLIFSSSSLGLIIYLLLFIFNILFNTFLFMTNTSMYAPF